MSAIMITGYTGTRHIRPSMDAAVYRGAFGNDNYVLSEDDNCEGSMPSVNEFVVADGCITMQGHAVQIKRESLSVDTCATGYARIDLVCCRFTHNTSSLIDHAELVIIKGDEVADSNTPQPPAYSEGIIDEGATQVDFPMYEITMHGGTVTFERLFTLVASLEECTVEEGADGGWKWREYANGKVEIWFHGQLTLNSATSSSNGVYRREKWFDFPNNYTLNNCAVFVDSMDSGSWAGCGGVQNASSGTTEPFTKFEVMQYRIPSAGPQTMTVSVYICGDKA